MAVVEEITFLLPAYDELENLRAGLPGLAGVAANWGARILVVDDGSADNTWAWLQQGQVPHVSALRLAKTSGQAHALAAGLAYTKTRLVLPLDADFQVPLSSVEALLQCWKGLPSSDKDAVVVPKLTRVSRSSVSAGSLSRLGNLALRMASGLTVEDFGCTSGMYPTQLLQLVPRGLDSFHRYLPWIAATIARQQGLDLSYLPVETKENARLHGKSHYSFAKILGVPGQIRKMKQFDASGGRNFVSVSELAANVVADTYGQAL